MSDNNFAMNNLARKDFKLSPNDPILILGDYYTDKDSNFYDIHYGVEVGIVLKGTVTRTFNGWKKTLYPGDVWVVGIWEPHGFELEEVPTEMICFVLSPESLGKILPIGFNWIKIFSQESNPTPDIKEKYRQPILDACSEIKEVINQKSEIALAWKANIITRILLYVAESNFDYYNETKRSKGYITDHSDIKKAVSLVFSKKGVVTVSEAAEKCMMSVSHFSRLFKKVTGVTFAKFSLGHRVKQSAINLSDTNDNIKEIATEWGFNDSSHYIKTFEKFFNVSPTAFRKQSKEVKDKRGIRTTDDAQKLYK